MECVLDMVSTWELVGGRMQLAVRTYIADAPCDGALFAGGRGLVCLALDAQVHDVVTADGAVVDDNVPGPQRDGVPLEGGEGER
jgi:hypothetical protein